MKNKEAVEILNQIYPKGKYSTPVSEALDLAIDALKKTDCQKDGNSK